MKHLLTISCLLLSIGTQAQIVGKYTSPPSFSGDKIIFNADGSYEYTLWSCTFRQNAIGQFSERGDTIVLNNYKNIVQDTIMHHMPVTDEDFEEIKYIVKRDGHLEFINRGFPNNIMYNDSVKVDQAELKELMLKYRKEKRRKVR